MRKRVRVRKKEGLKPYEREKEREKIKRSSLMMKGESGVRK